MTLFWHTLRAVLLSTIADFFYTPIWWYTRGLWKQVRGIIGSVVARQEALAIDVWVKNIFVPMYGQYDFAGRAISFFMRGAQIVGRMIILIIWGFLLLAWFFAWVVMPLGVV